MAREQITKTVRECDGEEAYNHITNEEIEIVMPARSPEHFQIISEIKKNLPHSKRFFTCGNVSIKRTNKAKTDTENLSCE